MTRLSWLKLQCVDQKSSVDGVMASVARLKALTSLWVRDCGLSDQGLAELGSPANLSQLSLDRGSNARGSISEKSVSAIARYPSLARLSVSRWTGLKDASLARLKRAQQLQSLSLTQMAIGDNGIMHLRHLTKLQEVTIRGCEVTQAGIAALKKARPKMTVKYIGK